MAKGKIDTKSGISRDDLSQKLDEQRLRKAQLSAKSAQATTAKQAQFEENRAVNNINPAISNLRGHVQRKFWAIVYLTTGSYVVEEGMDKRGRIPTAADIMNDKVPFGKYNKANIVSITVFENEKACEEEVKALQKARDKKGE